MDVDRLRAYATDPVRRSSWGLLESVAILPDHLEVTVSGVPRLNVNLEEACLTGGVAVDGVGGTT